MAKLLDPEQTETRIIHDLIDFAGKDVLDVGCGEGRLTWRFAQSARSVLGLDPSEVSIERARASVPDELRDRIIFRVADITANALDAETFDVAVLSWSLCCITPEGLQSALTSIHTALRPSGYLLDVRPAPQHPMVEISRAGTLIHLGQLDDSYRIGTQAIADTALQRLIDDGRFFLERKEMFTFVYHFESVDAWLAYMSEQWTSARINAGMIKRAREELSASTGEVRILRAIHAARLRRG